ncbi:tetratricopeptide repeat-containing glycosyltransferase family 2 protein [Terribacillus halophilus]|uniref:tetratricopeptide repeat-containing glycosyltransferase family 2 protein n=1 Tax=Terribacillus halophilus TaxID=361279 RepID=UPI000987191B|nr:glycosyltransferase [Terribacillus halophilus]
MKPFISLCMITKDEETVLNRCLDSVKGLVDEIIIADTGSSDRTKEIAAAYTEHVYDFEWVNDFSAARNFAQSKASGKWIIYLDADEYVDEENLKDVLTKLKNIDDDKANAFLVTQVNFLGEFGEGVTNTSTIRIYKNLPTISFYRKVHEQLKMENGKLKVNSLNLSIYHSGYLARTMKEKDKNSRNMPLINTELKGQASGFDYFNLGNEMLSQQKIAKAAELYKKAFQTKDSIHYLWVPLAVERLIHCLGFLKRYKEALKIVDEAIQLWSGAIDFRVQKALIFYSQGRYEETKQELAYLDWGKQWKVVNNVNYLEYVPYHTLGKIYEEEKDLANAVQNYSKALNFNKNDVDTIKRLFGLLVNHHTEEEVADFIEKNNLMISSTSQRVYIKALLDMGAASLVELLMQRKKIMKTSGLELKLLLNKGDFESIKSLIEDYSTLHIFGDSYFDLYDLVIISLELDDKTFLDRVKASLGRKDYRILEALMTLSKLDEYAAVVELLLSRLIKLQLFDSFERIISAIESYKCNHIIARVLYEHGHKELSAEFYASSDASKFNEQDYVNVMELAVDSNNVEQALIFGFKAIKNEVANFKVYQMTLECLQLNGDKKDIASFRKIMNKQYP